LGDARHFGEPQASTCRRLAMVRRFWRKVALLTLAAGMTLAWGTVGCLETSVQRVVVAAVFN
jgi:hypothetical protein